MAEPPMDHHEEKKIETNTAPVVHDVETGLTFETGSVSDDGVVVKANPLARGLQSRHMQMIAIGPFHSFPDPWFRD